MSETLHALISSEIPKGLDALHEAAFHFNKVSQYWREREESQDKVNIEELKAYTAQGLSAVVVRIETMSRACLQALEEEADQVAALGVSMSECVLRFDIAKEKEARKKIGLLTTSRKNVRQYKIAALPVPVAKSSRYVRKAINFDALDGIGKAVFTNCKHEQCEVSNYGGVGTSSNYAALPMLFTHDWRQEEKGSHSVAYAQPNSLLPHSSISYPFQASHYAGSSLANNPNTRQYSSSMQPSTNQYFHTLNSSQLKNLSLSSSSHRSLECQQQQYPSHRSYTPSMFAHNQNSHHHQIYEKLYFEKFGRHPAASTPQASMLSQTLSPHSTSHLFKKQSYPDLPSYSSLPPPNSIHNAPNHILSNMPSPHSANACNLPLTSSSSSINYIDKVITLYDYVAEKPDELTFVENSFIYVIKKNDDGWWEGTLESTGITGLFPGNYVSCV